MLQTPPLELVYSSRSKQEQYLDCPRYGYLHNAYGGRGLSRRGTSVYLATGSYTHVGMEVIFKNVQAGKQLSDRLVDFAVKRAVTRYQEEISRRGYQLEDGEDKSNESYVVGEQCALVEAFIRSAARRVIPDFLAMYRILDVEREEVVEEGNVILQGKLDVVLEEIRSGDKFIISWKTSANWDKRQEKANEHDSQGLSETYLLERRLHTQVMGVIMVYMMKGKRYENEAIPGRWEQHSPLIRGYRKLIGTTYEYAGSLFYRKPENKSGWGRLGKGWEAFNVWEDEEVGGVKGWVDKLARMEVGNADHIGESFKIPAPYFRNQDHINSWFRQTISKEKSIQRGIESVNNMVAGGEDLYTALDYHFEQRRRNCHYPTDCEMVDVCFNRAVADDPIGSGKYVWRIPHHKAELVAHEKLYEIQEIPVREVRTVQTVQDWTNAWLGPANDPNVVEIDTRRKPEIVSVSEIDEIDINEVE